MFSKIILVLATVCVVKASVFTPNLFDDDPETAVASNPKTCIPVTNPASCRNWCRRRGFPIGVCVRGRCQCRRYRTQEEDSEQEPLQLEDLVSRTGTDPETADASNPKSCKPFSNAANCRVWCRSQGFPTGVCIKKKCHCRVRAQEEDPEQKPLQLEDLVSRTGTDPETADASNPKSCKPFSNAANCRVWCRSQGFPTGVCIKKKCHCRVRAQEEDPEQKPLQLEDLVSRTGTDPETEVASNKKACKPFSNLATCRGWCQRLGFPTGVCVGKKCHCRLRAQVADPLVDATDDENEESNELIGSDGEDMIDTFA
ncbi:hypothetical protein PYW08_015205 [Mythimna loreyi]|uniref:Uncharacterized protein n=1 Tax=Mythimna loreyi TaxID=667449 RepID=A0ACC2QW00_9NEOP|nr:hypothetical protein PYW08_015205 [Mythimna loreyi]